MADYVLLGGGARNNLVRVVVHSTTPAGNNAVNVAWSTALVGHLESTVSVVPASLLPPGRQADLDAGTVYEWEFTHEDDAGKTPAERLASVEAAVLAREANEQTRLANLLRYWGFTGTVA